jgi:hypothetical protein
MGTDTFALLITIKVTLSRLHVYTIKTHQL